MNKQILTAICGISMVLTGCSDDISPIITSLDANRLFSPLNLEAQVVNQTSARLRWGDVAGAKTYNIEFYAKNGADSSLAKSVQSVTFLEVPYTVSGFEGETDFSVRIQAVGDGIEASKWTVTQFKTGTEQILRAVDPDELKATSVILRWTPGEKATEIVISPDNIKHTVTSAEIDAGAATIDNLTGETTYTAKLMNGVKTRGTVTFTTLIDLGGAKAINPGDDLITILDNAAEGDAFVIFPGEYDLGVYDVKKSVKLSGYKSNDKPVIKGQLTCSGTVTSIELKSLKFIGNSDPTNVLAQLFNAVSGCDVKTLSITDCDISKYSNGLIYNNVSGKFGDIIISSSIIYDIPGSGGDGIDFRSGTLGSMKVENTTFYNCMRTFLRMQAKAGPISFLYCTFYRTANYDNGNNHGMFRITDGDTFTAKNCLFAETGNAASSVTTAGNFCRQTSNMKVNSTSYEKNFYYNCSRLWEGLYTNPTQCDAVEANPEFKDAA
ncbi:MAG: fibronectin type III domain-containing protein, partial [Tannerella sp.]|nr:fibronectin type III domain-containing protein [Tannerella sp.]